MRKSSPARDFFALSPLFRPFCAKFSKCIYIDNVKKGTGKFTAYGTGEYFGKLTVSFKIAEDPSLEGNSGLSPSEPEPEPQKDVYEIQLHKDGSSENFDLRVGETAQLSSIVKKNGEVINAAVEYSSSASGVATVSEGGLVTGVKAGVANITAGYKVDGTLVASASITVNVVSNVYTLNIVSDTDLDLNVGETSQIVATVSKNGAPLLGAQLTYSSDNESAARVDATGLITATGKGNAVIKISFDAGEGIKKTAKINVSSAYKFVSKTLELTPATISSNVQTYTISENKGLTNSDVADAELASDKSRITVTSKAAGTTVLTVTFKDGESDAGTALVTLTVSETGEIVKSDVKYFEPGKEVKYSVQLFKANNDGLEFMSENDAIQPLLTELMKTKATGAFEVAIPAGTYKELLYYNGSADLVLSGKGKKDNKGADVVIQKTNSGVKTMNYLKNYPEEGVGPTSGYLRATTRFDGSCNVVLENLTIHNTFKRSESPAIDEKGTPDGNTQAEALLFASTGHLAAYNCSFKSHQDTIQTWGKTWFYGCYIEGDTDFTWIEHSGNSTVALYENCELKALGDEKDQAYYAAPRQSASGVSFGKGEVFLNAKFTEDNNAKLATDFAVGRSVANAGDMSQIAIINSTYEKTVSTLSPFKRGTNAVNIEGIANINVGWKLDQATATNLGYTSPFTTEDTRDILTQDEVTKEFSGRRAILNRKYNSVKNGYKKDTDAWYDVDWTIKDRKWTVAEDASKDLLDNEEDTDDVVYLGSKEVSDYPELTASDGFKKESGKNHWAAFKGSTLTIPVTGKCLVSVTGYYAGEGLISMEGQGSGYFNFNNGTTASTITKTYSNYSGAGDIVIEAIANSYITMITIEYDNGLIFTPVSDITISAAYGATEVYGGKTLQFKAALAPAGVTNNDVAWSIPEQYAAYATIDENTGLLAAAEVEEDQDIQVVCTARDENAVSKSYALKVKVATSDKFTIKWLEGKVTSATENPANNDEAAGLATGSALEYGGDAASWGIKNPTTDALLAYNGGTTVGDYGTAAIYLPVTAGEKAIAITNIKTNYGNHGTSYPQDEISYTIGSKTAERTIVFKQPIEDDDHHGNARSIERIKDIFIPIKAHETAYVRVALGNDEVDITKNLLFGQVTLSGEVMPTPGSETIYSFSSSYDKEYGIVEDVSTIGKNKTTSADGNFVIQGEWHDGQHGMNMAVDSYFKVKCLPGTSVEVIGCTYGNDGTITVTSDKDSELKDTFVVPHGAAEDKVNGRGNSATYTYTGDKMAWLTFTFTAGQIFMHEVIVRQGGKSFEEKTVTVSASKLNKYEDENPLYFIPVEVTSASEAVATAKLNDNNDVVITSKGEGETTVTPVDSDGHEVEINVTVLPSGTITYEIPSPYDPFVADKATLSVNNFSEADGRTTIIGASVEPSGIVSCEIAKDSHDENIVELTSVTPGTATVTVTMENGDRATVDVTVGLDGKITLADLYSYWYQDVITLSLNDLDPFTPSGLEEGVKITNAEASASANVLVTLSTNKIFVDIISQNAGYDIVTLDLDDGHQFQIRVYVAENGQLGNIIAEDVKYIGTPAEEPVVKLTAKNIKSWVGKTASMNVLGEVSDGGTITYQWYTNTLSANTGGTAIDGATSREYKTAAYTEAGTYYYYAVVTNTLASGARKQKVSDVVAVEVKETTVTYDCSKAVDFYNDVTVESFVSHNDAFWRSNGTGGVGSITIPLETKAIVTVRGCYSGTGTISCAAQGDSLAYDYNNGSTSNTIDYTYYVTANNPGSLVISAASQTYLCSITVEYDEDLVISATPSIQTQPSSIASTTPGSSVSLSVNATGSGTLSYQWYMASSSLTAGAVGWTPIENKTEASCSITAATGTKYYYVAVTNSDDGVSKAPKTIFSNVVSITATSSTTVFKYYIDNDGTVVNTESFFTADTGGKKTGMTQQTIDGITTQYPSKFASGKTISFTTDRAANVEVWYSNKGGDPASTDVVGVKIGTNESDTTDTAVPVQWSTSVPAAGTYTIERSQSKETEVWYVKVTLQ